MADKTRTLTNQQIQNLHEGLAALDGVVDKAGQNTEVTRYTFEDGVAWNIAKNLDIAERAVGVINKAKASIGARLKVVKGMQLTADNAASVAKFQDELASLQEKTQDLNGLLNLSRKALQTGNKIPPSVLKNLMPILTD